MPRPSLNLASNRLAAVLIALVAIQILLSAVIPQQEFGVGRITGSGEILEQANPLIRTLQLDRIYYSRFFQFSLVLLAVNLTFGNVRRFRSVHRSKQGLLKARHLGSMIFHFSLLVVIAGVLLNGATRFSGRLGMTEGQELPDAFQSYRMVDVGALARDPYGRFSLKLETINLEHPAGDTTTEAAFLTLNPLDGRPLAMGSAAINRPFRWEGMEFHMGARVGYSPEVQVLGPDGSTRYRSFSRLNAREAGPSSFIHRDVQQPFGDDRELWVTVLEPKGGTPARLELEIRRGETLLYSGSAALGDTVDLGAERLVVPRLRRWCYIVVVHQPWLWLVFTGFWLALAGQAVSVTARAVRQGGSET